MTTPYQGPYLVVGRGVTTLMIKVKGDAVPLSLEWLKAAFLCQEAEDSGGLRTAAVKWGHPQAEEHRIPNFQPPVQPGEPPAPPPAPKTLDHAAQDNRTQPQSPHSQ